MPFCDYRLCNLSCYLPTAKKSREPPRIDQTIDWRGVVKRYYINKGSALADEVEDPESETADEDVSDDK